MTRILVWNVQKFGVNKIRNPVAGIEAGTTITRAAASRDRKNYLLSHLALGPAAALQRPDIIVIIEITSRDGAIGNIARGAGARGSRLLLRKIRNRTGNPNWMLVPPMRSGPKEAVSIFFDSTNYAFTGPWLWTGGNGPAAAAGATGPYAGVYTNVLPNRVIPAGDPNAGTNERRVAPSWQSTWCGAHANAGLAIPFAPRVPYHARFVELNTAVAPPTILRKISLFAIHSPASANARQYFYDLADTAEIVDNIAANEVRVVLGDFNYNLLHANAAMTLAGAYTQMIAQGYAPAIARPGAAPAPVQGYKGYFTTITKPTNNSQYWSTAAVQRFYPVYGYADRLNRNLYSIDNLLAAYGAGAAAGGPLANATIINGVVGSPYNAQVAPGAAPIGHYTFGMKMANLAMFGATPLVAPAFSLARRTAFINWVNYRKIRSTSDHLAVVADI